MAAQSIFSLECFLAVVAIVTEIAREVGAFNVIPHIVPNKSLLPADGALEGRAPVLEHGVLQILVKHFSCIRRPWKIKSSQVFTLDNPMHVDSSQLHTCCATFQLKK